MKYLPPYSPDLNPIEQVFAKLKALLRKATERTVDKLWQAIGLIMNQFHPDECLNYFNNSCYVSRAIICYLRTGVLLESRRLAVTVVPETMPTPYSEDLRLRVVNAVENGKTTREVATLFQVSSSFVSNIHQCWKQKGHVHAKQIGGYRRAFLEPYEDAIKAQLSDHPSMTLKELQSWLANEQGLSLSISAIDKFVRQKLGYRYKKNRVRQ